MAVGATDLDDTAVNRYIPTGNNNNNNCYYTRSLARARDWPGNAPACRRPTVKNRLIIIDIPNINIPTFC